MIGVFLAGVVVGIALTLFTSLLTELILLVALVPIVVYIGRKRWRKTSTPSTTKTSPSSYL